MTPTTRVLTSLIALLALSGCGYTWSDNGGSFAADSTPSSSKALYPTDVRTVAVPIFTNQTYYRGVEFDLTKAFINELESRTPYKVVPREEADTILDARIINVQMRTINRYAYNALPQEQTYLISVTFTWKDLRSGKILVERHAFTQSTPYYPLLGETTFVGTQDSIEKLAIAIVEELQAHWGKATTQP